VKSQVEVKSGARTSEDRHYWVAVAARVVGDAADGHQGAGVESCGQAGTTTAALVGEH
jgi:hypothetical protein